MSNSLKDQLLGLGFKPPPPAPKPVAKPAEARPQGGRPAPQGERAPQGKGAHHGKPRAPSQGAPRPGQGAPRSGQGAQRPGGKPAQSQAARSEFDLGKAYALRAQKEKDERIAAEAAKQEQARLRREARAKLTALLEGKALNDANAEHARHFEYGGKIKRVHVTPEQLAALNRGELGVLQSDGRYLLVDAATLAQAEVIFAEAVALKVNPDAPVEADPYSDPAYQVPDDLIW
jgi:uncharacterized protein YaiL (DUF2058 family)